jgi:hypothetical protein
VPLTLQTRRRHPFLANQPRSEELRVHQPVLLGHWRRHSSLLRRGFIRRLHRRRFPAPRSMAPLHVLRTVPIRALVVQQHPKSTRSAISTTIRGATKARVQHQSSQHPRSPSQRQTSRTKSSRRSIFPQADIDAHFEATVKRALTPYVPLMRSKDLTADDEAKMFRLRLVGVYIFSNFFPCIFVLNDSFKQLHWLGDSYWHKIWFFRIWLWANAGCLYFRFAGSCLDLVVKVFFFCFSRR